MVEEAVINLAMVLFWGLLLLFTATPVDGFAPVAIQRAQLAASVSHPPFHLLQAQANAEDEEEEEKPENPYADPNYPDLEFVNYDDPEYQVDQGTGDEFFDPDATEAKIEEMREDRRRRNDECKPLCLSLSA